LRTKFFISKIYYSCKTELNARISQLEEELEKNNIKMKICQNENEQLKMKRSAPNAQLKELIEQLREECKQKDIVINNLNKTIKDDRSMRAMSAVRKPKDEFTKKDNTKVNNDLFQEIANLRKEIETQKTTIKNLEILKWDYEKNLKEIKEQTKLKLKEKDNEISDLQKKLEKIKVRLDKNESERQLLQNKIAKNDSMRKNINTFNKSTQINSTDSDQQEKRKLKQDLKKVLVFNY
jgi:chromosome segregation ATPase